MSYSWGFIYLAPKADPARERFLIEREGVRGMLVPVTDHAQAAEVAAGMVGEGVAFIELCGAFGHLGAARLIEATGGRLPIALCTRDEGSQFLWGERERFRSFNFYEPGVMFQWAYLFLAPGADPARDRFVIDHGGLRTNLVAVPDLAAAETVAAALTDAGIQFIELCGGFGHRGLIRVVDAVDGRIVVSVATVASESSQHLAALSQAGQAPAMATP